MSVLRRVSTCRPKQARKCTLDLFNYAFSFKACIFDCFAFMFRVLSFFFTVSFFLCRHQCFEKAFLLAVDLEARDLFMVSRKKISFYVLS